MTLLTTDGLRQFILEDATSVRLTDAGLRARVGAALDAARLQSAAFATACVAAHHRRRAARGDGGVCRGGAAVERRRIAWCCRARGRIMRGCKAGRCWKTSPAPIGKAWT